MARPGIGRNVEGVRAVSAALEVGRVEELLVEQRRADALSGLIDRARSSDVGVALVGDLRSTAATDAPQGVVARCRPIVPMRLRDVVESHERPALIVLDHLEDPRNVGAIARSALAAGMTAIVVSSQRAAPLDATAFKAAAGALEYLPVVEVSSVAAAIEELSRLRVWSVGLDAGGEKPLFGLDLLTEPVALVLGAEGSGLSRLVRDRVDVVASVPMDSRAESLNASVAAALAMFEVRRVRSR